MILEDAEGNLVEEIGFVLAMIGLEAIEPVGLFAQTATRHDAARITATGALVQLARMHPESRDVGIEQVCAVLCKAQWNSPTFNSFVIADLVDLRATTALDLIQGPLNMCLTCAPRRPLGGHAFGAFEKVACRTLHPRNMDVGVFG